MITNKSIVCFANDWENDPTSKHHVMRILSKKNKILWINSIGMRRPTVSSSDISRIFNKLRSWLKGSVQVNENLYHYTPIVLPFPSSGIARKINRFLLLGAISYYRRKLKMGKVQLWSFLPNIVEIVGSLDEEIVVYYCVDEWSKFSFMDGTLLGDMEKQLMGLADLVVTTADHLQDSKKRYNPNTHLLTHGVDHAFFAQCLKESTKIAPELDGIKRPVLGFFGLIHEWIDIELIEYVAKSKPDWSIVLIGKTSTDVSCLEKLPNVLLLGQKPYEDLVSYCKAFDVGMIPFRINELTVNVNPIKLREYLAAGVAVVTTPLPEIQKYQELVAIGATGPEFVEQVEKLLVSDSEVLKQQRSQAMREETWEQKVEYLSDLVEQTLEKKR